MTRWGLGGTTYGQKRTNSTLFSMIRLFFFLDDTYEVIEATPANGESIAEIIKRHITTVDLSNQSTYVQLGIGGATGW